MRLQPWIELHQLGAIVGGWGWVFPGAWWAGQAGISGTLSVGGGWGAGAFLFLQEKLRCGQPQRTPTVGMSDVSLAGRILLYRLATIVAWYRSGQAGVFP